MCDENTVTHSRNNLEDGVLENNEVNISNIGSDSEFDHGQLEFNRKREITINDDTAASLTPSKRIKLEVPVDKMELKYSEIRNNVNKNQKNDVTKNQDNDVTKKEKDDELDSLNENEKKPLFTFSCTIGVGNQFHTTGGRTPTLSMVCLEGDRNQFHQLFLCLKNKLNGALQVNS